MRKVLVVGSGGIKIAEAAEFDYSGSQALKALKEEGIRTVLVNPNVATIQTSHRLADRVYMLPLTPEHIESVIEKERPDGIMVGFGGQAALSAGVELWRRGVLKRYGVAVLGTPIEGIEAALSRSKFKKLMVSRGIPVPPSAPAESFGGALSAAEKIGYPVIVRVSFNLGGRGSFVAATRKEMEEKLAKALAHSPAKELLVEKYVGGWKEIEYEVVRDSYGNAAAVACLENIDPMGVHTGDSMVVAPCQTLTDSEYQELRWASIRVAESISLVGECNVQLALSKNSSEYYVIETNPRMSRSSALASKATGYPLAYIAAKLALGYRLYEILNKVTGTTCSCFEPSLDYVVVKMPRWDLDKMEHADPRLGSEMMSTGEVMALGRNLEEAYQKAVRMLGIGEPGLVAGESYESSASLEETLEELKSLKPYWIIKAAKAIKLGASVDAISEITGVDKYFLYPVENVVRLAERIRSKGLSALSDGSLLLEAKRLGFSDEQIAILSGVDEESARRARESLGIKPVAKNVDTLAGEVPAKTSYMYTTYGGEEDESRPTGRELLVLGAGTFRIGVSVEFDWGVVEFADEARRMGYEPVVLNCNPETVSTDWDVVGKLYIGEISVEQVLDVLKAEKNPRVAAFLGGQASNNIAKSLEDAGVSLVGTSGFSVDMAEDRSKFHELLEKLGLKQPEWVAATSISEALRFAEAAGYPVIVRPSYVLSGSAMKIARTPWELRSYLEASARVSKDKPVVVSKFVEGALEAEVDAVSDSKATIGVTIEHVEPAGVHSGDSIMVTPPYSLQEKVVGAMHKVVHEISSALRVKGPVNVQFLVKGYDVYVLEANLRASRSMPFSSKSRGVNLARAAAKASLAGGLGLTEGYHEPTPTAWAVKTPQFSWAQLRGSYPCLGPEMRSTGEVAAVSSKLWRAAALSWLASTPNRLPVPGSTVLVYGTRDKARLADAAREVEAMGFNVVSLEGAGVGGLDELSPSKAVELIRKGGVGLVATSGCIPEVDGPVRRAAADTLTPLLLDARQAVFVLSSLRRYVASPAEPPEELGEIVSEKIALRENRYNLP